MTLKQKLEEHQLSAPFDLSFFMTELVSLAQILGISFTEAMLRDKLNQCSKQKNALFSVKASKIREISHSIEILDDQISKKHNLIENEIDAMLNEAVVTLSQT